MLSGVFLLSSTPRLWHGVLHRIHSPCGPGPGSDSHDLVLPISCFSGHSFALGPKPTRIARSKIQRPSRSSPGPLQVFLAFPNSSSQSSPGLKDAASDSVYLASPTSGFDRPVLRPGPGAESYRRVESSRGHKGIAWNLSGILGVSPAVVPMTTNFQWVVQTPDFPRASPELASVPKSSQVHTDSKPAWPGTQAPDQTAFFCLC